MIFFYVFINIILNFIFIKVLFYINKNISKIVNLFLIRVHKKNTIYIFLFIKINVTFNFIKILLFI